MVLAELDDYQAVYGLVDSVLDQGVGSSVPAWAHETYDALPEDDDEATGLNFSALGRRLGIGPDAARDRALKLQELGYVINRETRKGVPARLVRGDPVPEGGEGFLPVLAALRVAMADALGRGETDPNVRNEARSRMDTGFELRVDQPEVQPETRSRPDDVFGDLRASGSPSGTPTRSEKPHEQRDSSLPSGLRVDSELPERECLVCGSEYLRDEQHPELLRCPDCVAGVAA
jgi:hypothetical protein